jgi:hypothetical protein
MRKLLKVSLFFLLGFGAVILGISLFYFGDFWYKRDAWEMAWYYESLDKTTARPNITNISDMGGYWLMEGVAGCWAATNFSLHMDKKTRVLSSPGGRVVFDHNKEID